MLGYVIFFSMFCITQYDLMDQIILQYDMMIYDIIESSLTLYTIIWYDIKQDNTI